MEFEWDEAKRVRNIAKHGIDFGRAIRIFERRVETSRSDRAGEQRFIAVGELDDRIIAVVYTDRDYPGAAKRQIISAREVGKYERTRYRSAERD